MKRIFATLAIFYTYNIDALLISPSKFQRTIGKEYIRSNLIDNVSNTQLRTLLTRKSRTRLLMSNLNDNDPYIAMMIVPTGIGASIGI
jgi:hypothetical protein